MTEQDLHRLVEAAHRNPAVADMIRRYVNPALLDLGWTRFNANGFVESCLIQVDDYGPITDWEHILQISMPLPGTTNLAARMSARADLTYAKVGPHILPGSVLDLGGGSGEIAMRIARDGHDVTIADVRDWRRNQSLGFVPVVNNAIAAEDKSHDTVIVLHVFHHSENPEALLKEAFRVARRRVIFIESVTETADEFLYTCWFDWFYNRVIHYSPRPEDKIPVPCRFLPAAGWEQMVLRLYGLTPTVSEDLGIYQILNPIHHRIFVYDR